MPPDEIPVLPKDFDPNITSMEVMRAAGEKADGKAAREVAELGPMLTNVGLATQSGSHTFAAIGRVWTRNGQSGILQVLLLSHSEDDLGGYNDSFMVLGADVKLRPFMPLDGRASNGGASP